MNDVLSDLRDLIQNDVGNRGLRSDPVANLVNAFPDDFGRACESIALHPQPMLCVVTGFFIPSATPPAGETDGPLGALFLARALVPIGIPVVLATDAFCVQAIKAGLAECGLRDRVPIVTLPAPSDAAAMSDADYAEQVFGSTPTTHLIAIERVGPNRDGRCVTMRGRDITDRMSPAHRLFQPSGIVTIGIGDGGNEIGMGKIDADVIARNIPNGATVACRTTTDHLIVAGVSNWGGYALATGVAHLRQTTLAWDMFAPQRERAILERMVTAGPLVDGVTGQTTATVDGLRWDQYAEVLAGVGALVRSSSDSASCKSAARIQ